MKKNRITTISIREIKHSFKRFLSLLVMSLLGVGVFVGISAASKDMMKSIDSYYDNSNYYDVKIISTLGITDDDITRINNLNTTSKVYGTHSKDVLVTFADGEFVLKMIGANQKINEVDVIKGRLPSKIDEVVVEELMMSGSGLKLGDIIKILDDEAFKSHELKIVGVVKSPLYISNPTSAGNRGNTNLGTGKIDYYAYVNDDNFDKDYYTEAYVTVKDAKKEITNTKEYNKLIDDTISEIEKVRELSEKTRYEDIYREVESKIKDGEQEGLDQLTLAKNELDSAKFKLSNGKKVLDHTSNTLNDDTSILHLAKEKLDAANNTLSETNIKLLDAKHEIDAGKVVINKELSLFGITFDEVNDIISKLESNEIEKDTIISIIPKDIENYDDIIIVIDKLYEYGLENVIKDVIDNPDRLDELLNYIPTDSPYYDAAVSMVESLKVSLPKLEELKTSIDLINKDETEYQDGLDKYNAAMYEYKVNYDLYNDSYSDYTAGLNSYNEGIKTYNSNSNLYNTKINEYYQSKVMFENKIEDAKKGLEEIPNCQWYVYERLDDSQYSNYVDDSNSIANISKVFPMIFFIVAVLISLISMSRMVEDDRSQIGTLKSLGFSNKDIRNKYILYAGIATILGGLIGATLGFFLLPTYIWNIYKILFSIPQFVIHYDLTYIIIGILLAVLCICGTTLFTIKKVVKEKPSDLMRPKAPSGGKRVILEKIPFIWNHIKFSNKVTIRNLFRYKKRVLMTVVGILGCTALMLTGFGIRDAIVDIPKMQFGTVFNFDQMVYLSNNASDIDNVFDDKNITNYVETKMITGMSDRYSVNVFVPKHEKQLSDILNLNDLKTDNKLDLKNNEIIISDKLSDLTNTKVGDEFTFTDSENSPYKFVVSGINENYVGNYVFMNRETYEKNIGNYVTNVVYLNIDDLNNENLVSEKLLENQNVMSVTSINSTVKSVNDMFKSMDSVVLILIILSAALSFVVLYNLSYINISERKREIATLKVLGFKDKEVDNYITKETTILTIIGIAFGLLFGVVLTNFIIDTVEIEMVRFIHHINLVSYVYSAIMTIIFTIVVNFITHFSLKKIDMIDSLKSVE